MSELIKRTITIIFLSSLLALLFMYGNNITFYLSIYILSILLFFEWNSINSKNNISVVFFIILMPIIFYLNIINILYFSLVTLLAWLVLLYCIIFIRDHTKMFIKKYFTTIGFFVCSSFFLFLMHMYPYTHTLPYNNDLSDNKLYFLFLIILISSIDIFAYISGKAFGKNKIINNISPNKTIEGYIGGFSFTLLFFILLFNYNQITWSYLDLTYLTVFILLAFFGDLFISLVKRTYQIKDTSNILPGHGGLLDRLDSYFPSLPLFYIWIMV